MKKVTGMILSVLIAILASFVLVKLNQYNFYSYLIGICVGGTAGILGVVAND